MITAIEFKLVALAMVLVVSLASTLLPLRWRYSDTFRQRVLSRFSFSTGGIFLGVGLLHMLPEAVEQVERSEMVSDDLPWTYIAAAGGFILLWIIDNVKLGGTATRKEDIVAVATHAADTNGASICFVHVAPVVTYMQPRRMSESVLIASPGSPLKTATLRVPLMGRPGYDEEAPVSAADEAIASATAVPIPGRPSPPDVECGVACSASSRAYTAAAAASFAEAHLGRSSLGHAHLPDGTSATLVPAVVAVPNSGRHARSNSLPSRGASELFMCAESDHFVHDGPLSPIPSPGVRSPSPSSQSTEDHDHRQQARPHNHRPHRVRPQQYQYRPLPSQPAQRPSHRRRGSHRHSASDALHDHTHDHVQHSHVVFSGTSTMLPFILAILFSVHSVIAGMALGLQASVDSTAISILVAIMAHKAFEAASVGSNFVKERVRVALAARATLAALAVCTARVRR